MPLIGNVYSNTQGNDRVLWARSLAEAGYTLVDGDFITGATLTSSTDAVWDSTNAKCYTWDGVFPKVVPAKSIPTDGFVLIDLGDVLRQELAGSGGFGLVGDFFNQEGMSQAGPAGEDLFERIAKRGQYDIVSTPGGKKALAGITFGGGNNKGTLLIDDKGQITTATIKDGRIISFGGMSPAVKNSGASVNGFPVKIMTWPSDGHEDNSDSPSLMIDYDENDSPRLWVVHPRGTSTPYSGVSTVATKRLVNLDEISGYLSHLDKFKIHNLPYNNQSSYAYIKLFSINGNTGDYQQRAKVLINASEAERSLNTPIYSLEARYVKGSAITSQNISKFVRCLSLTDMDVNNPIWTLTAGVVVNGDNIDVYLRMPLWNGSLNTYEIIYAGAGVSWTYPYDKVEITTRNEPTGIVWCPRHYTYNTLNTTVSSSGEIVKASPICRLATDTNTSARSDIDGGGFSWSGSGTVNESASSVSIAKIGVGIYQLIGCQISDEAWTVKEPRSLSSSTPLAIVEAVNSGNDVIVSVYERKMKLIGSEIVITKGDLMDVPMESWVDVRVSLKTDKV